MFCNSKICLSTITGAKHNSQLGIYPHPASSNLSADLMRNELHPSWDITIDFDHETSASESEYSHHEAVTYAQEEESGMENLHGAGYFPQIFPRVFTCSKFAPPPPQPAQSKVAPSYSSVLCAAPLHHNQMRSQHRQQIRNQPQGRSDVLMETGEHRLKVVEPKTL